MATLFTIAKKCQQLKGPSVNEWIKEMWYTRATQYYLTLKKNKALTYGTTWTNLENVTRSERSQPQKTMNYMIAFIYNAHNRETHPD